MATSSMNQQLLFPATEFKVQSPYLYLQTVGSTGVDGSTYGAHVRWLLLRNLGKRICRKAITPPRLLTSTDRATT